MARKRDPRRDEAFQLFKNANGAITNKEIAETLSVPEKTISAWKSRDKWNVVLQTNDCSTTNKVGAPIGNKNAVGASGNSRASPPVGNKNAVKTGEFESIYFDLLSDEEKVIYSTDFTLTDRLEQDVQELALRKYRMMKRINEAEKGLNLIESEKLYELRGRKQYIDSEKGGRKVTIEVPKVTMTEMKEKSVRKIEDILRIEDALTRISNQLTRTIKQLSEIQLNETRTKIIMGQADRISAAAKIAQHEANKLTNSNTGNDLLKALLDVKSGGDGSGSVEV